MSDERTAAGESRPVLNSDTLRRMADAPHIGDEAREFLLDCAQRMDVENLPALPRSL